MTVHTSETNEDGRCIDLLTPASKSVEDLATLNAGLYKIIFQTKDYFRKSDRKCFYPWVEVCSRLHLTMRLLNFLPGYIRGRGSKPTLSYSSPT